MCTYSIFISSIHDCFSYCFSKSLYISGWILFILYTNLLFSQVIFLSFNFFHDGFEKFKFCCMEDVKFKLCNKIHPSYFWVEILFCYVLQKTFCRTRLLNLYLYFLSHILWHHFLLYWCVWVVPLLLSCLMIGTSRYSVNISCYSVLCTVCSEIVIHGM